MRYADQIPMKKIVFTSGKGGVGKSTIAAAYGKILQKYGKNVLLVDFDISLRTMDIMLGVGDKVLYDWGDILLDRCPPEEAVIENPDGPDLLPAPLTRVETSKQDICDMISNYEDKYDFILMDSPAGVGSGFQAALSSADMALVLSTPDNICVRSAAVAAERLQEQKIPAKLIINRFERKSVENGRDLNVDDVIDETGLPLIGVVPEDENLAHTSRTGKNPDSTCPGAEAILRIIHRLDGERIPLKIV